jgi:hypothetical protein
MDNPDLKKLMADTNAVIKKLYRRRLEFANCPVNWADLECVRALLTVDQEGTQSLIVEIEEASPEAGSVFGLAIAAELKKLGWPAVEVNLEW